MDKHLRVRRDKALAAAEGYLTLEMPRHALDALRELDQDGPATFHVEFLRGEALRQLQDYTTALVHLDRAFALEPDHVSLLMALAWCYKRTGQLPRSISAMEHAYRLAPKEAVILYNLACYWALSGNKTQALSWLGRALRMDGDLRKLIPGETDFDAIRDDPDFQMMTRGPDELHYSK